MLGAILDVNSTHDTLVKRAAFGTAAIAVLAFITMCALLIVAPTRAIHLTDTIGFTPSGWCGLALWAAWVVGGTRAVQRRFRTPPTSAPSSPEIAVYATGVCTVLTLVLLPVSRLAFTV